MLAKSQSVSLGAPPPPALTTPPGHTTVSEDGSAPPLGPAIALPDYTLRVLNSEVRLMSRARVRSAVSVRVVCGSLVRAPCFCTSVVSSQVKTQVKPEHNFDRLPRS